MDDLKEHSKIIENFVASVRRQLKDHACCVYSNNIQYKCNLKEKEVTVVPDASISCRVYNKRKSSFFDIPRLVLEVISPSTEQYDHNPFTSISVRQTYNIRIYHKTQANTYTHSNNTLQNLQ